MGLAGMAMNAAEPTPPPKRIRTAAALLFVALLFAYTYTVHGGGGWNVMTRVALLRAIVHEGRLAIDLSAHQTGDKAQYPPGTGHFYCDKPIGAQLIALPGYALAYFTAKHLGAANITALGFGASASAWVASAIPTAALAVAMFYFAMAFLPRADQALLVAVLYALGTLAFAYAMIFFGHQLAAAAGFGSLILAWISARRSSLPIAAAAGLLAGLAGVTTMPAVFIYLATLGLLAAATSGPPARKAAAAAAFLAASLPPIALQLAYNWACFESPFRFGYMFEVNPQFKHVERWVGPPRLGVLLALLFSADKGLLVFSPWLAFAFAGLLIALRRPGPQRQIAAACAFVSAAYLLLNSGYYLWTGGRCLGPRLLVDALPFMAFGLTFALPAIASSRLLKWLFGAAAAWSLAINWMCAITVSEPGPASVGRPILAAALEQLLTGKPDWPNWAMPLLGSTHASFVLNAAVLVAAIGGCFALLKPSADQAAPAPHRADKSSSAP